MRTPLIIVAIVTISATACGEALPMWPSPASVPVSPASASGGLVSPTVDYRPDGTSAIAFVLKGRPRVDLPGGSVSPTVL